MFCGILFVRGPHVTVKLLGTLLKNVLNSTQETVLPVNGESLLYASHYNQGGNGGGGADPDDPENSED